MPAPEPDIVSQCEIGSSEIAYEAYILFFIVFTTDAYGCDLQSLFFFSHRVIGD